MDKKSSIYKKLLEENGIDIAEQCSKDTILYEE